MICHSDDHLVEPEDACPECGERRVDELIWQNDEDEQVRCATCGFVYIPPCTQRRKEQCDADATE